MILLKALLHWVRAIDLHVVEAMLKPRNQSIDPLFFPMPFPHPLVSRPQPCYRNSGVALWDVKNFTPGLQLGKWLCHIIGVQKRVVYNVTRLYTIRLWFWRPYWSFVRCWALQKKLSGCDWRDLAILARTTAIAQSMAETLRSLGAGAPWVWVDAVVMDLF